MTAGTAQLLLLLRLLVMLSMLLSLLVLDRVLDLERMLIELRLPILERAVSRGERGESAAVAAAAAPSRVAASPPVNRAAITIVLVPPWPSGWLQFACITMSEL